MTGVHVPWTPKVGDVVEARFNQPDPRRAPWWATVFQVTDVFESTHGPVVVAVDQLDGTPSVFLPGHDHVLRPAGEIEGQLPLLEVTS